MIRESIYNRSTLGVLSGHVIYPVFNRSKMSTPWSLEFLSILRTCLSVSIVYRLGFDLPYKGLWGRFREGRYIMTVR